MIVIRFSFVLGKFKEKNSGMRSSKFYRPVQTLQSKGLHKAPLAIGYAFTVL